MDMNDIEKIVVYMVLHRRESAQVKEIQKWTRFSDDRIKAACMSCENSIFQLGNNPNNPESLIISLMKGPETDQILKKYGDIMGIRKAKM
jgi:hypothetical protein